jgi:hypothetical protein
MVTPFLLFSLNGPVEPQWRQKCDGIGKTERQTTPLAALGCPVSRMQKILLFYFTTSMKEP